MEIKLTNVLFFPIAIGIRKRLLKIIMRTFIFLLCTTVFSFTPDNVLSQNAKITIEKDKTITVDEVFRIIKGQTDYRFIYESDMFKDFPKVTVKKGTMKANRLLKQSLSSGNFNFNFIDDKTIVIKKTSIALQDLTISGQVLDVNGLPIPGITVYVTNNEPTGERINTEFLVRGTATDIDGNFSLAAEAGYYLAVSGIGYEFKYQLVTANQTVYNITLEERVSDLDEVLVVGYGTTKRKDLTGSVGSVDSEDIQQIKTQSIDQALVGKISGVHVSANSGGPGTGAIVHVRGLSQLNGDNQPLYVVDGVPITITPSFGFADTGSGTFADRENPLLAINPNDVERVDVLKDASAAAIYGSRAANGVILITTKRGKRNQAPRFNFSYNTTIQNPTQKIDYLNAAEYRTFASEQAQLAIDNTTLPPFLIPIILATESSIVNDPDNYFGNADTDWQDKVLNKNAIWNQYNFSVSGGGEKTNYLVSATVSDQEGLLIGNKFTRYNFQTNLDAQLKDNLKVGASLNYNYSVNKQSGITNLARDASFRPDLGVFNDDGTYTSVLQRVSQFDYLERRNPTGGASRIKDKSISKNVIGSVYGELKLVSNLKLRSQINIGLNNDNSRIFNPSFTLAAQQGGFFSGAYDGANLNISSTESWSTTFSNTLNYNGNIGEDHRIDAVAGVSWDRNYINFESQTYAEFPDDLILTDINSANVFVGAGSQAINSGLNSVFGRINYNYKDRYLVTFTGRYDGSVKFGPNNRYGFFPSGAIAWNMHNETFLSENNSISQLKLRASFGRTGSDNLPAFGYEALVGSLGNNGSVFDGQNGIVPTNVPNESIQWESTDQLDLGLEFGLFNNRLFGEIVYFEKETNGIILLVPVDPQLGGASTTDNVADVTNKGWEIAIGGDIIRSKDFTWNSSFNISFIDNNVDNLNGGANTPFGVAGLFEGQPIGSIFGYEVVGIAQTQQEIDDLNANSPRGNYDFNLSAPGGFILRDLDGDGEITRTGDRKVIGDINPDYFGGWNNTFKYKNFDLGFNLQFVEGVDRDWTLPSLTLGRVNYDANPRRTLINNAWTPDNPNARYARVGSFTNFETTTRSIEDGSYIRLRYASIGYNLPQDVINKVGFSRARISVSGNNLFTITDYSGQDPENIDLPRGGSTLDLSRTNGFAYPQARTFTFGVELGF